MICSVNGLLFLTEGPQDFYQGSVLFYIGTFEIPICVLLYVNTSSSVLEISTVLYSSLYVLLAKGICTMMFHCVFKLYI